MDTEREKRKKAGGWGWTSSHKVTASYSRNYVLCGQCFVFVCAHLLPVHLNKKTAWCDLSVMVTHCMQINMPRGKLHVLILQCVVFHDWCVISFIFVCIFLFPQSLWEQHGEGSDWGPDVMTRHWVCTVGSSDYMWRFPLINVTATLNLGLSGLEGFNVRHLEVSHQISSLLKSEQKRCNLENIHHQ